MLMPATRPQLAADIPVLSLCHAVILYSYFIFEMLNNFTDYVDFWNALLIANISEEYTAAEPKVVFSLTSFNHPFYFLFMS